VFRRSKEGFEARRRSGTYREIASTDNRRIEVHSSQWNTL